MLILQALPPGSRKQKQSGSGHLKNRSLSGAKKMTAKRTFNRRALGLARFLANKNAPVFQPSGGLAQPLPHKGCGNLVLWKRTR